MLPSFNDSCQYSYLPTVWNHASLNELSQELIEMDYYSAATDDISNASRDEVNKNWNTITRLSYISTKLHLQ